MKIIEHNTHTLKTCLIGPRLELSGQLSSLIRKTIPEHIPEILQRPPATSALNKYDIIFVDVRLCHWVFQTSFNRTQSFFVFYCSNEDDKQILKEDESKLYAESVIKIGETSREEVSRILHFQLTNQQLKMTHKKEKKRLEDKIKELRKERDESLFERKSPQLLEDLKQSLPNPFQCDFHQVLPFLQDCPFIDKMAISFWKKSEGNYLPLGVNKEKMVIVESPPNTPSFWTQAHHNSFYNHFKKTVEDKFSYHPFFLNIPTPEKFPSILMALSFSDENYSKINWEFLEYYLSLVAFHKSKEEKKLTIRNSLPPQDLLTQIYKKAKNSQLKDEDSLLLFDFSPLIHVAMKTSVHFQVSAFTEDFLSHIYQILHQSENSFFHSQLGLDVHCFWSEMATDNHIRGSLKKLKQTFSYLDYFKESTKVAHLSLEVKYYQLPIKRFHKITALQKLFSDLGHSKDNIFGLTSQTHERNAL